MVAEGLFQLEAVVNGVNLIPDMDVIWRPNAENPTNKFIWWGSSSILL